MFFKKKEFVQKNGRPASEARHNEEKSKNLTRSASAAQAESDKKVKDHLKNNVREMDIDAERHPEEQNVDPKVYSQNDKKNLNGSPQDQKI